ncbi:hypothetical protein MSEN_35740 [Mycolicibacter senuensis]|uniref:HTH cro/C1-type domain-containing protein n=2 Tax=Mycolicibacter senuensis TaxID=386913 RepID=A0A7I9XPL5_9MYCO|nr:hypothetical protein MSEN_35740 [Mycolicibacter senuensis]
MVQRLRKPRSAQWLADRTAELGLKMTRQAIADLENGRRRYITTAELFVIAFALGTSPAMLLFGHALVDGEVEVLPNLKTSAIHAAQWFSGEQPLLLIDVVGGYSENNRALADGRELEDYRRPLVTTARSDADPEAWEAWKRMVVERVRAREAVEDRLRASGLIVSDDDDA